MREVSAKSEKARMQSGCKVHPIEVTFRELMEIRLLISMGVAT